MRRAAPTPLALTAALAFLVVGATAHGVHENDLSKIVASQIRIARSDAAALTLNATLTTDGGYVAVRATNTAYARGDWVGLYLASADPTATSPLKWTYCDPYMPGYNTSGTGSANFQVYNVRGPLIFHFFSGGTSKPKLIASSIALPFADYAEPLHPRVLVGSRPGDYVIAWTTNSSTRNPRLLWGSARGALTNTVSATMSSIAKGDLCGAPATTTGVAIV